mmetsp:Transcript_42863/g.72969  ORF Transcript_42863/g.72969 Transcript_42863/m.72969 type:complete len:249 (-) Transcript_42863:408-1154(-)
MSSGIKNPAAAKVDGSEKAFVANGFGGIVGQVEGEEAGVARRQLRVRTRQQRNFERRRPRPPFERQPAAPPHEADERAPLRLVERLKRLPKVPDHGGLRVAPSVRRVAPQVFRVDVRLPRHQLFQLLPREELQDAQRRHEVEPPPHGGQLPVHLVQLEAPQQGHKLEAACKRDAPTCTSGNQLRRRPFHRSRPLGSSSSSGSVNLSSTTPATCTTATTSRHGRGEESVFLWKECLELCLAQQGVLKLA